MRLLMIARVGGTAAALALLASSALPAGLPRGVPDGTLQSFTVQAQPGEAPDVGTAPPPFEGELPPPILPAPNLPGGDPVVELPPPAESAPSAPAAAPVFSFADLAARLIDSVVYISTSQLVTIPDAAPMPNAPPDPPGEDLFEDFFGDQRDGAPDSRTVQSLGSGFVIDPSGLIVTNNHVITQSDEIVANFANGDKLTAEVVGIDDKTDLALLKVEAPKPLPAAKFGRSEQLRVGDWVIAIGNPFGFGGSVTAGIVSALDRDINSGPYDHYIQTDASINRGNSGGPLFNINGEVVGINTAIMSPTGGSIGIGFAVPSEIAVPVIEQLRRFGEVRRGWIGVRIQDVTDEVAEGLGMERAIGAFIAGLSQKGPAAEGGIREGDVVVEFNGRPVESMRALPRIVADTPPGDTVEVVVVRDGERVPLEIEVGLLEDEQIAAVSEPEAEEGPAAVEENLAQNFGLTLGSITEEARQTYAIEGGVTGVLVTAVEPGSEAEDKSVRAGDVIVQVSQTEVSEPQQVVDRLEQLKSQGRRSAMFLLSGADNKLRFVSLRFEDVQ